MSRSVAAKHMNEGHFVILMVLGEPAENGKHPGDLLSVLVASFIGVIEKKVCIQVRAMSQAALLLGVFEVGEHGRRIPPTALAQEVRPDGDVLVRQLASLGEAPLENLRVRAAFVDASDKCIVANAKISEATPVEALPKPRDILRRKLAACVESNLVEHSGKPNHSICHFIWAARDVRHRVLLIAITVSGFITS